MHNDPSSLRISDGHYFIMFERTMPFSAGAVRCVERIAGWTCVAGCLVICRVTMTNMQSGRERNGLPRVSHWSGRSFEHNDSK